MNKQSLVKEFMKKAGQPIPNVPKLPKAEVYQLRQQLITEEYNEFLEAHFDKNVVEIIDSLCDMIYVIYGYANSMGLDLDPYFDEVHRNNMSKLPDTGMKFDDAGKILKPKGWEPPSIQQIYLRHCNQAAKGKGFDTD